MQQERRMKGEEAKRLIEDGVKFAWEFRKRRPAGWRPLRGLKPIFGEGRLARAAGRRIETRRAMVHYLSQNLTRRMVAPLAVREALATFLMEGHDELILKRVTIARRMVPVAAVYKLLRRVERPEAIGYLLTFYNRLGEAMAPLEGAEMTERKRGLRLFFGMSKVVKRIVRNSLAHLAQETN